MPRAQDRQPTWRPASKRRSLYCRSVASGDPSSTGAEAGDASIGHRTRARHRARHRGRHPLWRVWFGSFVIFAAFGVLWSLAAPLTTGPDETQQMIRAAAVVRGEWLGQQVGPPHTKADRWVVVPGTYRDLDPYTICIGRHLLRPPACPPLVDSSKLVRARTYVGRYPPLYYLLVGGPTLVTQDTTSVYAMRWMSVLFGSIFLSLAVALALLFAEASLVVLGVLIAATPLVLNLVSVVEPSGLEISAAICLWTCLALMAIQPEGPPPKALLNGAGLSGVVFALTRTSSPEWVIGIVIVAIGVLMPFARIRRLWGVRAVRRWLAAVMTAAVAGLAWIFGFKAYLFVPKFRNMPVNAGIWAILREVFVRDGLYLTNFAESFYPNDGQVGHPVEIVVPILLCLVVIAGLVFGNGRQRLVIVLLAVAALLLPFVVTVLTWRSDGLIWQGRYSMPFVVGLPIVAGTAIRGPRFQAAVKGRAVSAAVTGVVVLSLLTQFVALYGALRRFSVGPTGPLDLVFLSRTRWTPPLPAPVIAVAAIVVTLGGILWFRLLVRASWASPASPPPD
jgi:hypothetical protein